MVSKICCVKKTFQLKKMPRCFRKHSENTSHCFTFWVFARHVEASPSLDRGVQRVGKDKLRLSSVVQGALAFLPKSVHGDITGALHSVGSIS